jgi:hypothetical protein
MPKKAILEKSKKKTKKHFLSKINLKPVADIVFDLRIEFHTNRMSYGDFVEKILLHQF